MAEYDPAKAVLLLEGREYELRPLYGPDAITIDYGPREPATASFTMVVTPGFFHYFSRLCRRRSRPRRRSRCQTRTRWVGRAERRRQMARYLQLVSDMREGDEFAKAWLAKHKRRPPPT